MATSGIENTFLSTVVREQARPAIILGAEVEDWALNGWGWDVLESVGMAPELPGGDLSGYIL